MLAKHGEFFPYAVAVRRNGQIAMIAGYTGTEKPPSADVIRLLYEGLRTGAEENRAAAIVADVRLKGEGTDAIQIRAEAGERRIWPSQTV